MNPRTLLDFFKTPSGKLLVFGALVGASLLVYSRFRGRVEVPSLVTPGPSTNAADLPQTVETIHRPMEVFRPPPPRPEPPPPPPVARVPITNEIVAPAQAAALTPISLVVDSSVGRTQPKPRSDIYAPYGRLIPCETVITVDSSSIQTPIIGLITEDLYHAGHLVIPAGTEVHGSARVDRARERIASDNAWTLVWQTGQELRLSGIALDREFENSTNHVGWGITDGSAGLRGRLIKSDDLAELKLFAATFLSGAAKALTEREMTLLGPVDSRSLNNAPLKGAEDILGVYAQRILESIERDGFYVRIPSGKQFYLYVLQTIDRADAVFPDGSSTNAGTDSIAFHPSDSIP